MARYCGNQDSTGTLKAAAHWRDAALVVDGSVFTQQQLWTHENVESFHTYFVENPDFGEGRFFEKLERQLASAPPHVCQLAAEVIWVMRLCSRNITPPVPGPLPLAPSI